jgi:hypothetical protein
MIRVGQWSVGVYFLAFAILEFILIAVSVGVLIAR